MKREERKRKDRKRKTERMVVGINIERIEREKDGQVRADDRGEDRIEKTKIK